MGIKRKNLGDNPFPQIHNDDVLAQVVNEMTAVKSSPRALLLVVHGFIESMVSVLLEAKCKLGKEISENPNVKHSVKLIILYEKGVLNEMQFRRLDLLRDVRNMVAHRPLFRVDEFLKNPSKPRYKYTGDFFELCSDILLGLWNDFRDVFVPVFCPNVARKQKP